MLGFNFFYNGIGKIRFYEVMILTCEGALR